MGSSIGYHSLYLPQGEISLVQSTSLEGKRRRESLPPLNLSLSLVIHRLVQIESSWRSDNKTGINGELTLVHVFVSKLICCKNIEMFKTVV